VDYVRLASIGSEEQLANLGRAVRQLLLASYGLYPADLAAAVAAACRHLGGRDVSLLLADYDQMALVGFADGDDSYPVDGPGPGQAFRAEAAVEEALGAQRRAVWLPVKDSAERLGVMGVVDDGSTDLRNWETIASLVGELIVSKTQYGDHITLRRRRSEFSLAAEMRWSLLPPLTFTSPDVTIAGYLQPSHGVAGDAFDYGVTGRTASVAIFDAMGHGLEASRMANVAVGSYRNTRRSGADPVSSLIALDAVIATQFGGSRFVTAQIATFDLDSGVVTVVNAGHPPPLRVGNDGTVTDVECSPTVPAGLGVEPTPTIITLERGKAILFRSDGVVDARSPAGDFFGDERLAALVEDEVRRSSPIAEVLRRTLHAIVTHQAGQASDDATLLVLRWADEADTIT
jgi:serine phosphatase RsbU (regulator of sigma subunit)